MTVDFLKFCNNERILRSRSKHEKKLELEWILISEFEATIKINFLVSLIPKMECS